MRNDNAVTWEVITGENEDDLEFWLAVAESAFDFWLNEVDDDYNEIDRCFPAAELDDIHERNEMAGRA